MLGTVITGAALLAIVAAVIGSMIRDKRKGKSIHCGGDCKRCGGCHQ